MTEQAQHTVVQGGATFVHRGLRTLCLVSAGIGGATIFVASLVVAYSVVMRNLGFGGVRGDFELVELVCVTCASLFLPLCQLNKGHVMVDLFTLRLSQSTQKRIDGFWTLCFAAVWAVLCWRLIIGLGHIYEYGDRTMLLKASVWWAFVPAVFGTGLSSIVALITGLPMISPIFRALEAT
ncbi:Tripartite ATP-independent periplasmic transporters, DctQ component [Pacificibacter marinus]|jgi:TRAP-type C4-dicarboxylate transport system permease small subunit|uniref:TRAP transporter small permease protein n=1 Tax=Pacificibacter marinus TaxID=658057 RepID=A0A1Y5RHN0_9RHOB|nr:Tripartite ATP-independent periplasmic transporters, DctQ component [Pacificibacter marinus]